MTDRERTFRVEAVVLRHLDWGEADRLLTLMTLESGKLRAVGRGVRKPRSRKAGHLEPFTRVQLMLARGRDLPLVTQADTLAVFPDLRDDLLLATYASYVVEILDRFTYEEGENRGLYHLLADTIKRLGEARRPGAAPPELVVRYYEIRLLDLVGFRPQLFQCANCGTEIQPEDQYFSAEQGGVLCPRCGKNAPGARPISMNALRYLRHFQRSSFADAARAVIPPAANLEMENLIQHYITYLLERGLNTPAFVRRARREEAARPEAGQAGSSPEDIESQTP
jgi:DNA repair protein RecO (recombination protein O)